MTRSDPIEQGGAAAARQSVAILRFRAGDMTLAIAASDVLDVGPSRVGTPHVGSLVGSAEGNLEQQRVIRISSADGTVELRVDGPVELEPIGVADIVPVAAGFLVAQMELVLGFARTGGALAILLDVRRLVDAVNRVAAENPRG